MPQTRLSFHTQGLFCVVVFFTVLWLGAQLLNGGHIVNSDASWVAWPLGGCVIHDNDVPEPRDLQQNGLTGKQEKERKREGERERYRERERDRDTERERHR